MDERLVYYARWAWRSVVRRDVQPLVFGVAPTDRCNLACAGCRIPGLGRPDMTWEALQTLLHDAHRRGFREVYFSGGAGSSASRSGRFVAAPRRATRR